jgi:hypothetical protein
MSSADRIFDAKSHRRHAQRYSLTLLGGAETRIDPACGSAGSIPNE